MKRHIKENLLWTWFGFGIICIFAYIFFVIQTADRRPGCSYTDNVCVSSHTESSQVWQPGVGKYSYGHYVTREDDVCDDYETVTVPCDCITYHWFWGDHKNF